MRKLILLTIIISLSCFFLSEKNSSQSSQIMGITQNFTQTQNVTVSAFVGEHYFTLFGYTSPYALVTFDGQGIFDQTTADQKGYFIFNNRFSPLSDREACLSAKDQLGRISSPVCLPPFPTDYNITMGPIILAPTISLNKDYYYMGDEVILAGQTVPNSDVNLSIFTKNPSILAKVNLIKPVEAFTFPLLAAKSDSKGNFSLSLPSANPQQFRLFTQVLYDKSLSPASIKLNFSVWPFWMIIVQIFTMIIALIKPRLLEISICLEIVYIIRTIANYFFHPYHMAKNRMIILRQKLDLIKT